MREESRRKRSITTPEHMQSELELYSTEYTVPSLELPYTKIHTTRCGILRHDSLGEFGVKSSTRR